MKHLLVVLSIMVIFLFPFQPLEVQAETEINQDYLKYQSFQKKYYQHATELAYLASVSYRGNQHYFKENMDLFRQAAMDVFNANEGGFIDSYFDSAVDLFSKPVSFLTAANDVRKELFDRIKRYFTGPEEYVSYTAEQLKGYYYQVSKFYNRDSYGNITYYEFVNMTIAYNPISTNFDITISTADGLEVRQGTFDYFDDTPHYEQLKKRLQEGQSVPVGEIVYLWNLKSSDNLNGFMKIVSKTDNSELPIKQASIPQPIDDLFRNIADRLPNDQKLNDYTPTVNPVLICPSVKMPLSYENGNFKTSQGVQITLVNETATVGSEVCNLDFEFPEIYYHEDTNKLIVDGQDLSPPLPSTEFDTGIIAYIRNSYNYAVSAVQTGVDGLKTVTSGFVGITTLAGSVFAFLPPEILTFITAAFLITVGLWVVKR